MTNELGNFGQADAIWRCPQTFSAPAIFPFRTLCGRFQCRDRFGRAVPRDSRIAVRREASAEKSLRVVGRTRPGGSRGDGLPAVSWVLAVLKWAALQCS